MMRKSMETAVKAERTFAVIVPGDRQPIPRPSNLSPNFPRCNFYGKKGHIRTRCWELHGRPANLSRQATFNRRKTGGKGKDNPQAHLSSTSSSESGSMSAQEVEMLRTLMTKFESSLSSATTTVDSAGFYSSSFASHFAHISHLYHAFSTTMNGTHSWIIDSGLSRHIIGHSSIFDSYHSESGRAKVSIADGSLAPIAGKGVVSCTSWFSLSNVLHVPKFPSCLLSISSITKDLNCNVIFFS
ncbi:hypothetical protein Droror1_Dr00003630 [Drosera rotundifolia]